MNTNRMQSGIEKGGKNKTSKILNTAFVATLAATIVSGCGSSKKATNQIPTIGNNGATITLNEGETITMSREEFSELLELADVDGMATLSLPDNYDTSIFNIEEDTITITAPQVNSNQTYTLDFGTVSDDKNAKSSENAVINFNIIDGANDSPLIFTNGDLDVQSQVLQGSTFSFKAAPEDKSVGGVESVAYRIVSIDENGTEIPMDGGQGQMVNTGEVDADGNTIWEGDVVVGEPDQCKIYFTATGDVDGEEADSVKTISADFDVVTEVMVDLDINSLNPNMTIGSEQNIVFSTTPSDTILEVGYKILNQNGDVVLENILDIRSDGEYTVVTQGLGLNVGAYTFQPYVTFQGVEDTLGTQDSAGFTISPVVIVDPGPTNTVPVANDDTASVLNATQTSINVISNDTDLDGDSLTISGVQTTANAIASVVNNQILYTPNVGFNGTDTATYTISDGNGGTSSATVTIDVAEPIVVNTFPEAQDGSTNGGVINSSKTFSMADVISDIEDSDSQLTIIVTQQPVSGNVNINGTDATFNMSPGYSGNDYFLFKVIDTNGGESGIARFDLLDFDNG